MHRIPRDLLKKPVVVWVIGCGGTGSAIAAGLVYLHQSLVAFGHPHGLRVTLWDGDTISEANCVRQAFARSEIGLNKAVVIANRINAFWGLDWKARPVRFDGESAGSRPDIVIGCVDTRAARFFINGYCTHRSNEIAYWLDIGNDADDGQFILGQPVNRSNPDIPRRLLTVAERYPELIDASLDDDALPSCSAEEALTRQAPFVNQVLANHALSLLARLFRYGETEFHGKLINLATGVTSKLPVPTRPQLTEDDFWEIRNLAWSGAWKPAEIMDAFHIDDYELQVISGRRRRDA